ncbi:TPA: hypothetical protein QCQ44_005848, partial [Bacillus cereus]|nr:hypothetical protein [Bacillus cereus]
MRQLLQGMKLNKIDVENSEIKSLIDKKFVTVSYSRLIRCEKILSVSTLSSNDGCGAFNKVEDEDYVNCSECGHDINLKESEIKESYLLDNINYNLIIKECVDKIQNIPNIHLKEITVGNYIYKIQDSSGALIFKYANMDNSLVLQLLRKAEVYFCIDIDGMVLSIKDYGYCRNFSLFEFLQTPIDQISNELKYFPKESEVEKLVSKKEELSQKIVNLSTEVKWQDFEGPIVNFLLNKIRRKPKKLIEFEYLTRSHPFYAITHIQVGGAGNTDYRQVNLNDYLQVFFDRKLIIDAKRFSTSEIDNGVLEKVEHHVNHDPTSPNRVLIITTKEKVKCWNEIEQWKSATDKYKIVVITPSILAQILSFFEIEDEV